MGGVTCVRRMAGMSGVTRVCGCGLGGARGAVYVCHKIGPMNGLDKNSSGIFRLSEHDLAFYVREILAAMKHTPCALPLRLDLSTGGFCVQGVFRAFNACSCVHKKIFSKITNTWIYG
jgi:hypothetical protein